MTARKQASAADMATVLLSVLMGGVGVAVFVAGPTSLMPIHWGADGQADGWGTRELVGGAILALGFLTLLIAGGMGMAAGRAEDSTRRRGLRMSQTVVLIALTGVALFAGSSTLGGVTDMGSAAPMAGMSLLFLVIGAFLGRVGANPFVGVRTPWSYKSKLAWERSNRLAGRLYFLLGLAGLAASPLAPQPLGYQALGAGVLIAAVWSVFESWRVWRADPDRQPF
ncbi:MAG: SdpI family protein [Pseudomonadota bacterium]